MACGATLKRSYDFDILHTPTSTASRSLYNTPPPKKLRRSLPLRKELPLSSVERNCAKLATSTGSAQSPFRKVGKDFSLKSEHVLKNIYDEYKRMKRRKQLTIQNEQRVDANDFAASSSSTSLSTTAKSVAEIASVLSSKKGEADTPLLTIRQVGMICERLLREQEEKLSVEYEKVLVDKLSEQYDSFVKFNYDQIQRRMSEQPASYLS